MPRLKRTRDEAELDLPEEPQIAPELREKLNALRSQWEFASLMQYIQLFGSVVKIDDNFEIEVRSGSRRCGDAAHAYRSIKRGTN
jgi:hypothetical protein